MWSECRRWLGWSTWYKKQAELNKACDQNVENDQDGQLETRSKKK